MHVPVQFFQESEEILKKLCLFPEAECADGGRVWLTAAGPPTATREVSRKTPAFRLTEEVICSSTHYAGDTEIRTLLEQNRERTGVWFCWSSRVLLSALPSMQSDAPVTFCPDALKLIRIG